MKAFLEGWEGMGAMQVTLAQVLVRRERELGGYELRHVEDANLENGALTIRTPREMRSLVQHNDQGMFRPLRTSPDLKRGWRLVAPHPEVLEEGLECIYPGALADWFAAQVHPAPVTHFREYTQRQTGMFRVITRLDDLQAAETIRACCSSAFCMRRRLWTVPGLDVDQADLPGKSVIPCLEPCALLMELARKAARLHQDAQEKGMISIQVSRDDLTTLREVLEKVRDCPEDDGRQADFADRLNPRRLQWLLERLPRVEAKAGVAGGAE